MHIHNDKILIQNHSVKEMDRTTLDIICEREKTIIPSIPMEIYLRARHDMIGKKVKDIYPDAKFYGKSIIENIYLMNFSYQVGSIEFAIKLKNNSHDILFYGNVYENESNPVFNWNTSPVRKIGEDDYDLEKYNRDKYGYVNMIEIYETKITSDGLFLRLYGCYEIDTRNYSYMLLNKYNIITIASIENGSRWIDGRRYLFMRDTQLNFLLEIYNKTIRTYNGNKSLQNASLTYAYKNHSYEVVKYSIYQHGSDISRSCSKDVFEKYLETFVDEIMTFLPDFDMRKGAMKIFQSVFSRYVKAKYMEYMNDFKAQEHSLRGEIFNICNAIDILHEHSESNSSDEEIIPLPILMMHHVVLEHSLLCLRILMQTFTSE